MKPEVVRHVRRACRRRSVGALPCRSRRWWCWLAFPAPRSHTSGTLGWRGTAADNWGCWWRHLVPSSDHRILSAHTFYVLWHRGIRSLQSFFHPMQLHDYFFVFRIRFISSCFRVSGTLSSGLILRNFLELHNISPFPTPYSLLPSLPSLPIPPLKSRPLKSS